MYRRVSILIVVISTLVLQGCLFETRDPVQFGHVEEYGDACAGAVLENNLAGPGFALFLTILSINLIGDGLRDHFDVRSVVRREQT
jgi:hypothetical protein